MQVCLFMGFFKGVEPHSWVEAHRGFEAYSEVEFNNLFFRGFLKGLSSHSWVEAHRGLEAYLEVEFNNLFYICLNSINY